MHTTTRRSRLGRAGLGEGDHIHTVAATIEGRVVSGSTIFSIPAV